MSYLLVVLRCSVCGCMETVRLIEADVSAEIEWISGLPFAESMTLLEENPEGWRTLCAKRWQFASQIDRAVRASSERAN